MLPVKKLITSLLAAFLLSAGLVAVTGSQTPANAACGNPRYPACYETTSALLADREGQTRNYTFTAGVIARGTNAVPTGRFQFRFSRVGSSAKFAVRRLTRDDGGVKVLTRRLRPGRWNVTVTYIPPRRTVFQGSKSENVQIDVPRRR